ncbi:MAG: protein-export chaperone SecB [Alphaproteobacteria bacterium]
MTSDATPPASPEPDAAAAGAESGERPFLSMVTQYVKDLSFESPRAPTTVMQQGLEPHGDVSIRVTSRPVGDDRYEVLLEFNIAASDAGEVVFLVELVYAGVFTMRGFEDELREMALMVECPRILFPFARHVIYDTVRDGGFPPLMIAPIDFLRLYQQGTHGGAKAEGADA